MINWQWCHENPREAAARIEALEEINRRWTPLWHMKRVRVTANDYKYDGYVVGACVKLSGAKRVIVQSDDGRIMIHNYAQLELLDDFGESKLGGET